MCAVFEALRSGEGQVVDAAMIDGAALLAASIWGFRADGWWGARGTNLLDTGAWFYDVYETSDEKWISIGSLEPQFFAELIRLTGLAEDIDRMGPVSSQEVRSDWPEAKKRLAALIRTKTRADWCALMEGTDVCFAPVLDLDEAPLHPHHRARDTFVEIDGVKQPAPAPRFSRTPGSANKPAPTPGQHTRSGLMFWGFGSEEIDRLFETGAVG
jgi:alpha-methylacyl-CoA racemase